jgi:hypothetical protein
MLVNLSIFERKTKLIAFNLSSDNKFYTIFVFFIVLFIILYCILRRWKYVLCGKAFGMIEMWKQALKKISLLTVPNFHLNEIFIISKKRNST